MISKNFNRSCRVNIKSQVSNSNYTTQTEGGACGYPCTFFNVPLFIFINEIQGKAFVIHLSFGDRNRFYIDYFSVVNVRQISVCLGPRGHRVI